MLETDPFLRYNGFFGIQGLRSHYARNVIIDMTNCARVYACAMISPRGIRSTTMVMERSLANLDVAFEEAG